MAEVKKEDTKPTAPAPKAAAKDPKKKGKTE